MVVGNLTQTVHGGITVPADEKDDLHLELDRVREILFRDNVRVVFEQRGDTLPGHRRDMNILALKMVSPSQGFAAFTRGERVSASGIQGRR